MSRAHGGFDVYHESVYIQARTDTEAAETVPPSSGYVMAVPGPLRRCALLANVRRDGRSFPVTQSAPARRATRSVEPQAMTNFQQLFQMGQQVQAKMSELQTELGNRTITTSSGGGLVTVTADGRGIVKMVRIDASVVDPNDIEMLEDLVTAAVAEAQQRAAQAYEEEMKKLAGGFPLPFNLPSFS
jgi:nucleoid-associated protein EbfC